MERSCGCSTFRPKYKQMVNNIYPYDKVNLDKLTYYARAKPEKLDRIGNYLAKRIARDLARHKTGYVIIGVEAMDGLLTTSNSQSLNLFVESYLRVVQQLIESLDIEMQLLGTQSFVKFAAIEEDTPSYHRRYDFFVSKFASMSHCVDNHLENQRKLRMAGLDGLKGVILKTVSDDLQANIWDETHMDKIVPSLLYNMQTQPDSSAENHQHDEPATIAEDCLKELMRRATFGHIRSVIRPVLKHLDNHDLWKLNQESRHFSIEVFKIIMYSIQTQHSYAVIQILMEHLDDVTRTEAAASDQLIKIGIVTVLSSIIAIAASESIGPSVLEIINSLLEHLRNSMNTRGKDEGPFQEAVMDTLAEFSSNLPDYQKTEILFFIKSRAPTLKPDSIIGVRLQKILQDLRGSGPETHFKVRHSSTISISDVDTASDSDSVKKSSDDEEEEDEEEITNFEALKNAVNDSQLDLNKVEEEIVSWYRAATYEDLLSKAKSDQCNLGNYCTLSMGILTNLSEPQQVH